MGHLIWVLIALWAIAAMEIDEQLLPVLEPKRVVLLHALLTFIFLTLFWLQLTSVTRVVDVVQFDWVRFGLLFGVLLLVVMIASIVSMGWSGMIARQGLGFGVVIALGIFTLAGLQGTTQITPWNEIIRQELWLVYPQAGNVDLLKGTLNDLSRWNTGRSGAIDIASAVESPSLNWALREFDNVTQLPEHSSIATLNNQGPENMPAIIISRVVDETPELASYYRGQDFEWGISPEGGTVTLNGALRWLVFRQGSWQSDVFILWARSDLFPGGILEPAQEDDNPVLDGIEPYE